MNKKPESKKASPKKRLLATDNKEVKNSIADAVKQLDKISISEKHKLIGNITEYLNHYKRSYSANFNSSIEPSKNIRKSLSKIANKAKDLRGQIDGLSWQTRNKFGANLSFVSSGRFDMVDVIEAKTEADGKVDVLSFKFKGSRLYQYLIDIEGAAKNAIKNTPRTHDSSGYYLVGYCHSIFIKHCSERPTRDGNFKKFVDNIWNAVFDANAAGASGAIKNFIQKNPHLFPRKKSE